MLLSKEGSGLSLRAKHTFHNSLNIQLSLLSSSVPAIGWLVCERRGSGFSVLAYDGIWCFRTQPNSVSDFMFGAWRLLPQQPDFQYRALDDHDSADWRKACPNNALATCFLRRPLRDVDSRVRAWVLGAFNGELSDHTPPVSPLIFSKNTGHILTSMALSLSLFGDFKRANTQLNKTQRDAFIEPLTGLLNRAGWEFRIEQLCKDQKNPLNDTAVIILDLDLLKLVNDLQGHSAGDDLLRLTATTLQSVVRGNDIVARLGGDEFGIVAPAINFSSAKLLINRIGTELENAGVRASIGMALLSEAKCIESTLDVADERMYLHKRNKNITSRY